MDYIPPGFSTLKANTINLYSNYGQLIGRYRIDKTATISSSSQQSSFEKLSARANKSLLNCKTDREGPLKALKKLLNDLRDGLRNSEPEKHKFAVMVLLGALLHRYFRIIKEYGFKRSFFGDERGSDLFKAIREILALNDDSSKFREMDLKVLDVTTIVHSLTAFRSYMIAEERYKAYEHFADPTTNFISYLNDLINEHSLAGAKTLNQFKAIQFIQSLMRQRDQERQDMESELTKLSGQLQAEHPDFSKLSKADIEAFINRCVQSESTKGKLKFVGNSVDGSLGNNESPEFPE